MKEKNSSNKRRTQWHPAFYAATRLEFRENKNDLEFITEYGLNTKPIIIDLLIIKKTPDSTIHNEIGRFFKRYNIFEYKSPRDSLNIDTLYKGIAYASLYKSQGSHVDEIPDDDITLTFIRQNRPGKLFRTFDSKGVITESESPGIYRIKCLSRFDIRIIVTRELDPTRHVWLSALTDKMSLSDAERLIRNMKGLSAKDSLEFADSVLNVAMTRNTDLFNHFKEGYNDMGEALREFFRPELEEAIAKIIAEKDAALQQMDAENKAALQKKDATLQQMDAEIIKLKKRIAELSAAQSDSSEQKI